MLQVDERGKLVCQPDGFYPPLTTDDVTVSTLHCLQLQAWSKVSQQSCCYAEPE